MMIMNSSERKTHCALHSLCKGGETRTVPELNAHRVRPRSDAWDETAPGLLGYRPGFMIRTKHYEVNTAKNWSAESSRLRHLNSIYEYFFSSSRQSQRRYKVLEMDTNGTLYLHKTSLICVSEIIKRLTEGTYRLAEPGMLGNTLHHARTNNLCIMKCKI